MSFDSITKRPKTIAENANKKREKPRTKKNKKVRWVQQRYQTTPAPIETRTPKLPLAVTLTV